MMPEDAKSLHKELLLANKQNKPNKIYPLILVAPAILMSLYTILFSKSIWLSIPGKAEPHTVPAHTFLYGVIFLVLAYLVTHIPKVLNIMRSMMKSRVGFGIGGRLAKQPSSTEVSCIIFLLRAMILISLYIIVINVMNKYA